jgi:hypothetical protein
MRAGVGWPGSCCLRRRGLIFLNSDPDSTQAAIVAAKEHKEPGHYKRQILRVAVLIVSVAIPIGFIADVDHVRPEHRHHVARRRRVAGRAFTRDRQPVSPLSRR